MRAELKFDLSIVEDREQFEYLASGKAESLKTAVHNFATQTLRKYRKYGLPEEVIREIGLPEGITECHEACQKLVEHIESQFYEVLEEYGAEIE